MIYSDSGTEQSDALFDDKDDDIFSADPKALPTESLIQQKVGEDIISLIFRCELRSIR